MESRHFELVLVSARDLPNVPEFGQMKIYAHVSITGESDFKAKTPVDRVNQTNPYWNYTIKCTLPEKAIQNEDTILYIKFYCERPSWDKYVGEVNLHIKKLFDERKSYFQKIEYDVVRWDSVGAFGKLKLWYSFTSSKILGVNKSSSRSGDGNDLLEEIVVPVVKRAAKIALPGVVKVAAEIAAEIALPGSSIVVEAISNVFDVLDPN